jgi:hypothetical protein
MCVGTILNMKKNFFKNAISGTHYSNVLSRLGGYYHLLPLNTALQCLSFIIFPSTHLVGDAPGKPTTAWGS